MGLEQQGGVEAFRLRAHAVAIVAVVAAEAGDAEAEEVADQRLVEIEGGAQAAVGVDAHGRVAREFPEVGPVEGDVIGAAREAGAEEDGIGAGDEREAFTGIVGVERDVGLEKVMGVVGAAESAGATAIVGGEYAVGVRVRAGREILVGRFDVHRVAQRLVEGECADVVEKFGCHHIDLRSHIAQFALQARAAQRAGGRVADIGAGGDGKWTEDDGFFRGCSARGCSRWGHGRRGSGGGRDGGGEGRQADQ